jgi:alpha-tubulin suppressor-like RCC1 family protein
MKKKLYLKVKKERKQKRKLLKKKKSDEGESDDKKVTKPRKKYKKESTFKPVEAKAINELKETRDIKIKKICGGDNHTLLLTKEGEVYAWGSNEFGQTGHGDSERVVEEPRIIAGMDNIVDIGCHSNYSIAINEDGEVFGFGAIKSAGLQSNRDKDYSPVRLCGV